MADTVIEWMMDRERSDPSIRWQVMRDLLDSSESEWGTERARVATEGVQSGSPRDQESTQVGSVPDGRRDRSARPPASQSGR